MIFSSVTFLLFFLPAVLLIYYILPNLTYKNCVLVLASLLFYAWGEPKFVFLMFASIVFNYIIGLFLGKSFNAEQKNDGNFFRKPLLAFAILVNIGILFIFKYLGFSCAIINEFLNALHIQPLTALNLVMPIGISFYTFQEISYLVDVYRKPELTQKNLLNLGLYISFFPQLIAGPIVRYHDINEQIQARSVTVAQFANGLERFIIGLSKKVLLANTFALVCDSIYDADFFSYGAYAAWIAAIAYSLQIFYDFSGYSDMAIGLAKLFGFELLENFNYPYAADSITDFWRRWHISLTNFFRDYVYIPLGGNRKGKARAVLNRFIVFFTTGLWHGAAFNFIFWGLAHGGLMALERRSEKDKTAKKKNFAMNALSRAYTLLCVLILWVLFRNDTKDTIKLLLKMAGVNYTQFASSFKPLYYDALLSPEISVNFYFYAAVGVLLAFPWWKKITVAKDNSTAANLFSAAKYIALAFLLILCCANLAGNSYNPFIYFRF